MYFLIYFTSTMEIYKHMIQQLQTLQTNQIPTTKKALTYSVDECWTTFIKNVPKYRYSFETIKYL